MIEAQLTTLRKRLKAALVPADQPHLQTVRASWRGTRRHAADVQRAA